MTNMIYSMTKKNIFAACLLACAFAVVSNVVFNFVGGVVVNDSIAQNANTLIDVLQLIIYVSVKVYRFKGLSRYDLPFLIGGSIAIIV